MIVRLIMCFITAVALCMRFELPEELNSLAGGSRMLNIFYNFQLSLTGTMAAATAVFAALVILEKYLHSKKGAAPCRSSPFQQLAVRVWVQPFSFAFCSQMLPMSKALYRPILVV